MKAHNGESPRRVTNLDSIYIEAREAASIARYLKEDYGFKVTDENCEGYVMNVVNKVAGSEPDSRADVYATICVVLNVTDGEY